MSALVCLIVFFLIGCKTYTPENLPDRHLHFGKGGGFTGMTTEYMLLPNGQLFIREGRAGSGEWKALEQVEKATATALYRTWENNELFKETVQQPGNLYYFITMKKDSLEYRQSWGANGYQPDAALKLFYQRAVDLTKTSETDKMERN